MTYLLTFFYYQFWKTTGFLNLVFNVRWQHYYLLLVVFKLIFFFYIRKITGENNTSEPQQLICHKWFTFYESSFNFHSINWFTLSRVNLTIVANIYLNQITAALISQHACYFYYSFTVIIIYTTLIAASVLPHYCCQLLLHFSLLISLLNPFISFSPSCPIAILWSAR